MKSPSELVFTHQLVRDLPGAVLPPTPSRQTPGIIFAETTPTPVSNPELLIWSPEAAALLDLPADPGQAARESIARIFSGNQILPGSRPYATRYGGHQFGSWAGQLGDGRAITLGEVQNSPGEFWEVQLKGAGPTPYSRNADGRAVLRSSLREFLCSEAMHHLGVPTTRALCCVTTGDPVIRDMFYDGNPQVEPGAITTRLAPSFLRLGHFEILAAREENELLATLVTTSIRLLFPELAGRFPAEDHPSEGLLLAWFEEITNRTADLMVEWQRVGFVHGVMNTDNLSILGLTIDYGPYGWLDVYDPEWTPNTTDAERRRYRFGNQPSIALWNLSRFGSALLPLFPDSTTAIPRMERILENFRARFGSGYLAMRARKLGFILAPDQPVPAEIQQLLEALDRLLVETECDMTLFYRLLARGLSSETQAPTTLLEAIQDCFYGEVLPAETQQHWLQWLEQLVALWNSGIAAPLSEGKTAARIALMDRVNPYFILRNYLVQEALDGLAQGDRSLLDGLMKALRTPYLENEATRPFFKRRPDWARGSAGVLCALVQLVIATKAADHLRNRKTIQNPRVSSQQ